MSAAPQLIRPGRAPQTFESSVVESDLKYWGYWKGRQCAADGYSPENSIAQIMSGRSDRPGHRVLCLDMKPRAWQINARVLRLPAVLVEALIARYCLPVKLTGHPYQGHELADVLGVSHSVFRQRLADARRQYRAHVFHSAEIVLNS